MAKQKQEQLKLDKQAKHRRTDQAKIRNLFKTRAEGRNVQNKTELEY